MARPGPQQHWVIKKSRVRRDLKSWGLKEELGDQLEAFIKFAAKQRFDYEENIFAEIAEFQNRDLRISEINQQEWEEIRKKVFERDDYTCEYCGEKGGVLEVDHKIPFSRGGSEQLENLTTSCRRCNRQKRDKTVEEYINWKEDRDGTIR